MEERTQVFGLAQPPLLTMAAGLQAAMVRQLERPALGVEHR